MKVIRANAGLGEQAGAIQAAEKLRDLGWGPPVNAYEAACALSLCVPIVQGDNRATKEARDQQAAFYGGEAMKMLRDALAITPLPQPQTLGNTKEYVALRADTIRKRLNGEIAAVPVADAGPVPRLPAHSPVPGFLAARDRRRDPLGQRLGGRYRRPGAVGCGARGGIDPLVLFRNPQDRGRVFDSRDLWTRGGRAERLEDVKR